jgi:tRNA (guanine37-N1)-methyltransferase
VSDPLRIDVVTLFPQWFSWMAESRPVANALKGGEFSFAAHDFRPYSQLSDRQVDDTPYGGGPGMVLRVDVLVTALEGMFDQPLDELRERYRIVALSPAGRQFDDAVANEWAADRRPTIILCGRYEGFDYRVHEHVATEELSVGPYVLSGGETAAMAIIDAVTRKLPGALGNQASLDEETFSAGVDGGSEYPHYTRPEEFRGWTVPPILLGGHHAKIAEWRREQGKARSNNN